MEIRKWVKLTKIEKLNNSADGNPRWQVWVETSNGDSFCLKTKRNGRVGLLMRGVSVGSAKMITYHATKAGNFIMTDIEVDKKWTVMYEIGCSNDRYYFKDRETYKAFCREVFGYKEEDFMYDCERYVSCHYRNEERRNLIHKLCNVVCTEEELILGE